MVQNYNIRSFSIYHFLRTRPVKKIGVIIFIAVLIFASVVGAENQTPRSVKLLGSIEGMVQESQAIELYRQYLGAQKFSPKNQKLANAIVAYIGPEVVKDGKFIPPKGIFIPEAQLEIMGRKIFLDDVCHIERLNFLADGITIVLIVNNTKTLSKTSLEHCFLEAFAISLGAEISNISDLTTTQLKLLIQELKEK